MGIGKSNQTSDSSAQVWSGQSPFLQNLFKQGSDMLGNVQQQNNQVQQQTQQAYGNQINPQGNPYLQQMGQAGLGQLNEQFGKNLSQIKGNSVNAGNLGSSRQGIAEGEALGQMQQTSSDFISNLYGGNYQQDQNRAASLIPYANQVGTGGYAPLQGLKGIYGDPAVLNSSQGRGSSFNFSL